MTPRETAEAIRRVVSLSRYLTDRGYEIKNGRTVARWRGGDGWNVSVDDAKGTFCDHGGGRDEGGDLFNLVKLIEGLDFTDAVKALASRYGVDLPGVKPIADTPWKLVASYEYRDEVGRILFGVERKERVENGKRNKAVRQYRLNNHGAKVYNLDGVHLVPYRLPELLKAARNGEIVFVAEGEKNVEDIRRVGYAATCNPQGAGKWRDEYSAFFVGARVTIIADADTAANDFAGQRHAVQVCASLAAAGVDAHIVYAPKGKTPRPDGKDDISDFLSSVGYGVDAAAALKVLAENPDPWTPPWSLANFTVRKFKDEKGKERDAYIAVPLERIRDDLFAAAGWWPRMVGGGMLVFDPSKRKASQRYRDLKTTSELFAWIGERMRTSWRQCGLDADGVNFATRDELFASVAANAVYYEGISHAPHFPRRDDQFYDYGKLPQPSRDHEAFWKLVGYFCPASDAYRTLIAALFAAPMYHRVVGDADDKAKPKPMWIIDTVDAQGSGKSSVVYMVALLYGDTPIKVDLKTLSSKPDEFTKRVVSKEGRSRRLVLIDNATGTIEGGVLAEFATAQTISGKRPYGHGEEARVNDLTWCITVNGAEIDTDAATRSYTIKVRKPDEPLVGRKSDGTIKTWEDIVGDYITANRLQIYAEILDMLHRAKPRASEGRFPDFDATVLSAVCATDAEFDAARNSIEADAVHANVDAELADSLTDAVEAYLDKLPTVDSDFDRTTPTMITHKLMRAILAGAGGRLKDTNIKQMRTIIKSGLAPKFSKRFSRFPASRQGPRPEVVFYGMQLIADGASTNSYQVVDLVFANAQPTPRVVDRGEMQTRTVV